MGRAARTTLAIALLGAAGAGAAWSVYRSLTTTTDVYTDAGSIAEPAEAASPRGVLWEPPIVELESAREPRTTPDGSTLYFVREGPGGDADIYAAERTGDGWGEPQRATFDTRGDELSPAPMSDGSLLFTSDRGGGLGGYDLWRVRHDGSGWGAPENLGPAVNSFDDEFGAAPAGDGVVYFASNRPREGASGDDTRVFDLFRADLNGEDAQAERLAAISSAADDGAPAVSPAGDFLYFASERAGGLGGSDLYRVRLLDDGFGEIEPMVGINTEGDERAPWLDTGGFRLWFGSDRAGANSLYAAMSREVYRDRSVAWSNVDWASIWRAIWPWLTGLVVVLLILAILGRLSTSVRWKRRWRTMSLMAKCVFVSLLAHALLLAVLTAVHVTTTIGNLLDEPGETKVRLVTHAGAGRLTAQVRGSVGEVVVEPVAAEEAPRAEPVEVDQPDIEPEASAPGEMDVAELATAAPSAGESSNEHASEAARAEAEAVEAQVDVSRPDESRVTDSTEQVNEPAQAVSRAVTRRAEPPVDEGSGTPIAQAEVGALTMHDDSTSAGGEAPESAPNGSVDPTVEADVATDTRADVRGPDDRAEPRRRAEASPHSSGVEAPDARAAVRVRAVESGAVNVAPGRSEVVESGPIAAEIEADESTSAHVVAPELRRDVPSEVAEVAPATPSENAERVMGDESPGASVAGVSSESPRAQVEVRRGSASQVASAPDALRVADSVVTIEGDSVEASVSDATLVSVEFDADASPSASVAFDVDVPSEHGGDPRDTAGEAAGGEVPVPASGSPLRAEPTFGVGSSETPADSFEPESLALVERAGIAGAMPSEPRDAGGSPAAPAPSLVAEPKSSDWDAPLALPSREREAEPTEREHAPVPASSRSVAEQRAAEYTAGGSASLGRVEVEPERAEFADAAPAPVLSNETIESRPSATGSVAIATPKVAPPPFDLPMPAMEASVPEGERQEQASAPPDEPRSMEVPVTPEAPVEAAGADMKRQRTEPEALRLVETRTDETPASREAAVELTLPPPEAELALVLPGVETRLPREEASPRLRLEGVVLDSMSREPLAGASVRLDADRADSIEVATDAQGRFRIDPKHVPDHAAVTASAREYRPRALNISAEQLREHASVVFLLEPLDTSVVVLEDEPRVHHLGDNRFDGRINSQFQKSSEGLSYQRRFELDADQLRRVRTGEVTMMVKGAQIENQIRVNGRLVDRRLTGAPSDGSFGEFRARVPASWLREGTNSLEVRSVINRGTDHDDFEFVNVQIELIRPKVRHNL